jgi:exopolyphosphatase/guanosine-5'-triphosphate,3'-diphosphate pyrophosphatase
VASSDRRSEPLSHRVAAVDVGSNAIRYVIAEVSKTGAYLEVESERIGVRLGKDVFTKSRTLTAATMDAGVGALSRIRRRIDDLGIAHYRAIATSAVRESRNGGEFVDRIRRESGIHLETISGSEEAKLVWLAVNDRMNLSSSRWFLMDLGGGSVEVSVVDREGILWTESHTLGSVRLLQAFSENGASLSGEEYRELRERYVHSLKVPRAVAEW